MDRLELSPVWGTDQFTGINTQRLGQLPKNRDTGRDRATFYRAEITSAEVGTISQFLLAQFLRMARAPNRIATTEKLMSSEPSTVHGVVLQKLRSPLPPA